MSLLRVENMTHFFGGLRAVHNYDLEIGPGEVCGLIGPNGAGKTTFFNCLTGMYAPTEGEMLIRPANEKSRRLNGLKPNYVTAAGLARTYYIGVEAAEPSAPVGEKRPRRLWRSSGGQVATLFFQVEAKRLGCWSAQRHQTLLVSFAFNPKHFAVKIKVNHITANQFRNPDTC